MIAGVAYSMLAAVYSEGVEYSHFLLFFHSD